MFRLRTFQSEAVPETVAAPVEGDALAAEPPPPSMENDDESRDEGDSDPDSSSDEEANEPVLNPSKDIKVCTLSLGHTEARFDAVT